LYVIYNAFVLISVNSKERRPRISMPTDILLEQFLASCLNFRDFLYDKVPLTKRFWPLMLTIYNEVKKAGLAVANYYGIPAWINQQRIVIPYNERYITYRHRYSEKFR